MSSRQKSLSESESLSETELSKTIREQFLLSINTEETVPSIPADPPTLAFLTSLALFKGDKHASLSGRSTVISSSSLVSSLASPKTPSLNLSGLHKQFDTLQKIRNGSILISPRKSDNNNSILTTSLASLYSSISSNSNSKNNNLPLKISLNNSKNNNHSIPGDTPISPRKLLLSSPLSNLNSNNSRLDLNNNNNNNENSNENNENTLVKNNNVLSPPRSHLSNTENNQRETQVKSV